MECAFNSLNFNIFNIVEYHLRTAKNSEIIINLWQKQKKKRHDKEQKKCFKQKLLISLLLKIKCAY